MKISVALCTYNGDRYLSQQLQSLASQTRLPFELVVCDDRSSDNTIEILSEFAKHAPFRVRIIRNPVNLRSTKNFEKVVSLCEGDLIALCDQDDLWNENKLERLSDKLEEEPSIGGVFSDSELIDANSSPIGTRFWKTLHFSEKEQRCFASGDGRSVLLRRNVVAGTTLMFRADLRCLLHPIPTNWVHDGWIAWMLALYSRLDIVPEPLIRYRIHSGQQCGVSPLSKRERIRSWRRRAPTHYSELVDQFQALRDYVVSHPLSSRDAYLSEIDGKIAHCRAAAALSANPLARAVQICGHLHSYGRYTVPVVSICKDLMR